ncbi:DUF1932 domain-containing protein [Chloroflexota bacterium]
MDIKSIGILSPGDMGSAIGKILSDSSFDVITCLEGRSELTQIRAQEAGIRSVPSLDELTSEADIILSVLVPSRATALAELTADSVSRTGTRPVYVDLNAIAPQTVKSINDVMTNAGITFIDAGIIGSPPKTGQSRTRIYCSGENTSTFESIAKSGLDIRRIGPNIGQASGLKMIYAASTKGITALWTELLTASKALGLNEALMDEYKTNGTDISSVLERRIPSMPRRSRRWVGEMEEIAKTFEGVGLTPKMLLGAADIYRLIGKTSLGDQTSREPDPSTEVILKVITERLKSDSN